MKKTFDYKKLYLEQYKNIPNFYFVGTMILGGAVSTILGLYYLIQSADYSSYLTTGLLVLLGGWCVTVALSFLTRWISSVAISQSVVVADTLMSLKNDVPTSNEVENELPEL